MLYNQKWDRIFTLEAFADWLGQQPKDKFYSYVDVDHCAAAQYMEANGLPPTLKCERLDELGWTKIVCAPGHHTFGEAAMRARLYLRGGWRLRLARLFGVAGLF